MITENSTIFIIEDNMVYGKAVQKYLGESGFKNVKLFNDEQCCLNSMDKHPDVLISDYHLNYMNGLELIDKARKKSSGFYSILLSGTFDKEKYSNSKSLHNINYYIRKDGNEFMVLSEVLSKFMDPAYIIQFY